MPNLTLKCTIGVITTLLSAGAALSQSDMLALSSGSTTAGGTVSLNLTLTAAITQPAGLQWTLSYSPAAISAISVTAGAAAASAGKTATCASASGSYQCLLAGLNTTVMQNGVAAVVTVTIAAGVSTTSIGVTGSFAASAAGNSIPLTATGGTITTTAAVSLTQFTCNPTVLGSQAASTCSLGLSGPAPAGGLVVTVSDSSAYLTVPGSVTIAAGNSAASFQANAGAISSTQTATITAVLNGVSKTVSISLVPPLMLSSLACNPTSLVSGTSSTCTVMLTQPAPSGGTAVSLSSSTTLLTVPASVTVPAGTSSATFTAIAGSVTTSLSATVTATLNGSSRQVSLQLAPKILVSSLGCNSSSLISGSSTSCTVTLSRKASVGTTVQLTDNNVLLTIPSSVSVPSGSRNAGFTAVAGTIPASQSATITAGIATSLQTTTLTLAPAAARPLSVTSVSCDRPIVVGGAHARCTVHLAQVAPAGGGIVRLTAGHSILRVPNFVKVEEGSSSASFTLTTHPSLLDQVGAVIAGTSAGTRQTTLTVSALKPVSLSCNAPGVHNPEGLLCEVSLNAPIEHSVNLTVTGSANVQVPATIVTRPLQSSLTFEATRQHSTQPGPVWIQVAYGSQAALYTGPALPAVALPLLAPHRILARIGEPVKFSVAAADTGLGQHQFSLSKLPAGALFDPTSGSFDWTPASSQQGSYNLSFTTAGSAPASVAIEVTSGEPLATSLVNSASQNSELVCSPGSVASVLGKWLDNPVASSDKTLPEVRINRAVAPVLFASATRVDFLCPQSSRGEFLNIQVQTILGQTHPIVTTMQAAAPGIFTVDGASQGVILFDDSFYATVRSYRAPGFPAQPGDHVSIRATGLAAEARALVNLGGIDVPVESIQLVDNIPGVYDVRITVPAGVSPGDAVPVRLQVAGPDGTWYRSNVVTMATELPRP